MGGFVWLWGFWWLVGFFPLFGVNQMQFLRCLRVFLLFGVNIQGSSCSAHFVCVCGANCEFYINDFSYKLHNLS